MKKRTQPKGRIAEFTALMITIAAAFAFTIALMSIAKLRFAEVSGDLNRIVEPDQSVTGSIEK